MEVDFFDNLKWAKDPDILKEIGREILYYSNKIIKINQYNQRQERFLVLTEESLYNFKKKTFKRKIEYRQIRGITISKISSELFVIHGNEFEYDYYYQSQERNLIIKLIAKLYEEQNGKSLKICEINEKNLKSYVTGKKEKEKKKDINFSRMDETKLIDINKFLCDNKSSEKKKSRTSSSCISINNEEKKIEDENPILIKTNMIFCNDKNLEKSTLENFKIIKILSRGDYGKIFLVKNNDTKKYYAMKSIKKIFLENKNEINLSILKKQKIQNLKNNFLIGCEICFQTDERVYFILNLIEGENFSNYLYTKKSTEEKQIKFFMALIGLALEYFHKNGIDFRNLNPNDIIIEKDGYLKISDIKLSSLFKIKKKEGWEYTPPEELSGKQIGKEGDWWIFGIILYELFFGIPPFFSEDEKKIKDLIEKSELRFPKEPKINNNAKDLIIKLLNKNPEKRLGHNKDFDEIKNHEFFHGFNFNDIINKKMKSNYCPQIGNIITDKEKRFVISYEDAINSKIFNI